MIGLWRHKWPSVFLWPLSCIFGIAVQLRNRLYEKGTLRTVSLDAKVISVGNITVGGTGKTPLVEAITRSLNQSGLKPAIVSRGYGRKTKEVVMVSDGRCLTEDTGKTGDEPLLLARRLPGIPVVVGDRILAGQAALSRGGIEVLVLDDAFQHRKVRRDLDIVTLDAECPLGNSMLLPAGPLREPFSSLERADVVVITRVRSEEETRGLVEKIGNVFGGPVLLTRHRPVSWISMNDRKEHELGLLEGKRCLAFAGIGSPPAFLSTLLDCGVLCAGFIKYRDHHEYSDADLVHINDKAEKGDAEAIVTTEKDGTRIRDFRSSVPAYCLRIEIEFLDKNDFMTILPSWKEKLEGA